MQRRFSFISSRYFLLFLMVIITMVWGYAWVLMKQGLSHMGPLTFSSFRFWSGGLSLIILLLFLGRLKKGNLSWKAFFVLGMLQTAFVFTLVMYAMRYVHAGKTSVLLYTMPIWSTLLASRFLGEKLTGRKVAGLVMGTVGLVLIMGLDLLFTQNLSILLGECLILLAALSWSLANIYLQLKFSGQDMLQVCTYQMCFGALGLTLLAVFIERGQPILLSGEAVFGVLFTGIVASALCFSIWYYILDRVDIYTATFSTLLVPCFGVFFSWLLLNEPLTMEMIIGGSLILCGIAWSQWKGRKLRQESVGDGAVKPGAQ